MIYHDRKARNGGRIPSFITHILQMIISRRINPQVQNIASDKKAWKGIQHFILQHHVRVKKYPLPLIFDMPHSRA